MSGRSQSSRGAVLLLAGFLASCASGGARPETKVAPAYYPAPGSSRHLAPVRAVPVGDPLRFARTGAPPAAGGAALEPGIEARVFVLVNRERRRAGRRDLVLRRDLVALARAHAADMARRGYFSHTSPEGLGPGDRAVRAGIRYGAFAENLARVRHSRRPGALALRGWLESPGHRRNLLDERRAGYRYTGVGAARADDGSLYVSQVFLR